MVFVGDGPLRPVLEAQVKQLGLTDRVIFAGWQSNAEVREHLRAARALVMPSFAENLPVAMMEALATGRPVLGTYIAGVPELVEPGMNGWLVPAGNVRSDGRRHPPHAPHPRGRTDADGPGRGRPGPGDARRVQGSGPAEGACSRPTSRRP